MGQFYNVLVEPLIEGTYQKFSDNHGALAGAAAAAPPLPPPSQPGKFGQENKGIDLISTALLLGRKVPTVSSTMKSRSSLGLFVNHDDNDGNDNDENGADTDQSEDLGLGIIEEGDEEEHTDSEESDEEDNEEVQEPEDSNDVDKRHESCCYRLGFDASHIPDTDYLSAFSHYTYVFSKAKLMVVDLQGCLQQPSRTPPIQRKQEEEQKEEHLQHPSETSLISRKQKAELQEKEKGRQQRHQEQEAQTKEQKLGQQRQQDREQNPEPEQQQKRRQKQDQLTKEQKREERQQRREQRRQGKERKKPTKEQKLELRKKRRHEREQKQREQQQYEQAQITKQQLMKDKKRELRQQRREQQRQAKEDTCLVVAQKADDGRKRFVLTDPAIHQRRGRQSNHFTNQNKRRQFGRTDLGSRGMRAFFESHECNDICRLLGLRDKKKPKDAECNEKKEDKSKGVNDTDNNKTDLRGKDNR